MRVRWVALVVGALLVGAVAVKAADHPDSKTESIADGCSRAQLGLLGEAAATMLAGGHPTPAASWVYVNGDNQPKTVEGTVLSTHTAGTDLFGVHDTYDLNIDVKPDPGFADKLSSRNAEESPPQIHDEWESGLAPLFAWPEAGDRVRNTGALIWDCGHWQSESRKIPESDYIPGDPLAAAGVEEVGGEEIEIHPISELATWRSDVGFDRPGGAAGSGPVRANRLDVAISNQGGKAKAIEECALLSTRHPANVFERLASGGGCSPLSPVAGHDYTYDLRPPGPKPSRHSKLVVHQVVRYGHNAPRARDVRVKVGGDVAHITVPFGSVKKSTSLQDFGATWNAWWSDDRAPVHRLRVTPLSVTIRNNLDADNGDAASDPLITPNGEWNMLVAANGQWVNLHDPRPGHADYMPALGSVPSAAAGPVVLSASRVPAVVTSIPGDKALHLFTDARECDQPGYIDCPAGTELGLGGRSAGRAEISLPASQLVGHSTVLSIHPPLCGPTGGCPEDKNAPSLCPKGCYDVTFRIDDLDASPSSAVPASIAADGTGPGLRTTYGPSQEEENVTIAAIMQLLRAKGYRP